VPRRRGSSLVVDNLREQPVEIHHGGAVIVIQPFGRAELPRLPLADTRHLAELERRRIVVVEARAASPRPKTATARPAPKRKRRGAARTAPVRPGRGPGRPGSPKPSEGGN
jgi:hypothetical protein